MTYQEYMNLLKDKVIETLSNGINPWQPTWDVARNGISNRPYNGINSIMLSASSFFKFGGETRWYSFDQAHKVGSIVKKGEKATPLFFFEDKVVSVVKDEDGNPVKNEDGTVKTELKKVKPFFKVYNVFNAQQLDPVPKVKEFKRAGDDKRNEELGDRIITDSPVPINYKAIPMAFYDPKQDSITVPPKSMYTMNPDEFYSTVFHEMAHSTGADSRLDRNLDKGVFGNSEYAVEELIAEISALALCDKCDFKYTNANSAAYIASWLSAVKDPSFRLSDLYTHVNKATRFLLNPKDRELMVKLAQNEKNELAYEIGNKEGYFHVQKIEEGFDYSFYEGNGKLLDGGILTNAKLSISEAVNEICGGNKIDINTLNRISINRLEFIVDRVNEVNRVVSESKETYQKEEKEYLSPSVKITDSNYVVFQKDSIHPLLKFTDTIDSLKEQVSQSEDKHIDYEISFNLDGKEQIYKGSYIFNSHLGLVESIEQKAKKKLEDGVQRNNPELVRKQEYIINKVVPCLVSNNFLSNIEKNVSVLAHSRQKVAFENKYVAKEFSDYKEAALKYVQESRELLDKAGRIDFSSCPTPEDFRYEMPFDKEVKKVYISGPISNNPFYEEDFEKADIMLQKSGYETVNPVELVKNNLPEGLSPAETWRRAMEIDLKALNTCDALVLLDRRNLESTGMDIEISRANSNNIPCVSLEQALKASKNLDNMPIAKVRTDNIFNIDSKIMPVSEVDKYMADVKAEGQKESVKFSVTVSVNGKPMTIDNLSYNFNRDDNSVCKIVNDRCLKQIKLFEKLPEKQQLWMEVKDAVVPKLKELESKEKLQPTKNGIELALDRQV